MGPDDKQVNGLGWYLKPDGTLINPWFDSSAIKNPDGSRVYQPSPNNPNGSINAAWGTFWEPNANSHGQYINSISQLPTGAQGVFALGQRPDSYLGLTQSPIIDQQRQNIATKSKIGYGGELGRYQFANNATPGAAFKPTTFAPPAGYQLQDKQNALNTNRQLKLNTGYTSNGGLQGAGPVDPAQASAGYGGLVPNNTAPDNTVAKYMQQGKVPVAGSSPMNWVPTTNVPKQTTNVGKLNWSQLSDADLAYAQSLGQQDPGRYKNFINDAINWGNANMASELMRVDYNTPIASMDFNSYNGPLAALAAAYNGSKNYTSGKK